MNQYTDDVISREVVLGVIKELPNANPSYSHTCNVVDRADLVYLVERLESVQPQQLKGKWLDKKTTVKGAHGLAYGRYGCSVCKRKFPTKSNFCPDCGSDMRGEENDK